MRAAWYERHGAADEVFRLGDLAVPEPGPGDVLVRLATSGINPADWKARSGMRGEPMPAPRIIPHHDGAGMIEAVGPGVPDRIGERVWLWNDRPGRSAGTAAEYIVVPARQAVLLPDHVGFAEGACLGIPAMTAMRAVRIAAARPPMRAMVMGAAGAVGAYIVQILATRGIETIAVVSSAAKADHARAAGAAHIIDYRRDDIGARCADLTRGLGVDRLFDLDLARNAVLYPRLLRRHARVIVFGTSQNEAVISAHWLMRSSIGIDPFLVFDLDPAERDAIVADLSELLAGGRLHHAIARIFPLDAIAEAHRLGEGSQAIGNIVLAIDPACAQATG